MKSKELLKAIWKNEFAYAFLTFMSNYMLLIHVIHEKLRDWILQITYIPYAIPLLEHTLIIALLLIIHNPIRKIYDWFASALIIAPFWIMLDIGFRATGVIPTVQAIKTHFFSWFDFMPFWTIILTMLWLIGSMVFLIFSLWQMIRKFGKVFKVSYLFIKVIATGYLFFFICYEAPNMVKGKGLLFKFKLHTVIPAYALIENGRMASFVLYSWHIKNMQEHLLQKEISHSFEDILRILFPDSINQKRNVYAILLESFFDPRDLDGVQLSQHPIHPSLRQFLQHDTFYYASSNYVSWGTAQTSFEFLTGIPGLHKYSDVEFALFTGKPIPSMVNWLKKHGYVANAIVAAKNDYYNMPRAYKSLGFDTTVFLGELEKFADFYRIPDSAVYEFVVEFNKQFYSHKQPVFTYIVTMYGHWPWDENPSIGPDIIEVIPKHPALQFMVNDGTYWRTKQLADFIRHIILTDSNALIVFFGDHTAPFMDELNVKYKRNLRHVPYLIIDRGTTITIPSSLYALPFYRVSKIVSYCIYAGKCDSIPQEIVEHPPLDSLQILYEDVIRYGVK